MVIPKIIYALEDTLNKILLTDKLLLPHFLLFWRGIINSIIALILTFILYCTSSIDFRYYENIINNITKIELIFKIFSFLFLIFKIFCIFKIIYIFTPQHVGFCIVIIYIYNAIKSMILMDDILNRIVNIILNIISLTFIAFGTLIFNEMVIINYCGFYENTKTGKIDKEQLDNIELNDTNIFNENDEDDKEGSFSDRK